MIPFNDLQRLNKSIFKEIERELQTLLTKVFCQVRSWAFWGRL